MLASGASPDDLREDIKDHIVAGEFVEAAQALAELEEPEEVVEEVAEDSPDRCFRVAGRVVGDNILCGRII